MNYVNTFIRIAPDSPAKVGTIPPIRGSRKPIHVLQYEIISETPYQHTQEDVLWITHIYRKDIPPTDATEAARSAFFKKDQPCLRTSALSKKYGWGFHFDDAGRVALISAGTTEYDRFTNRQSLQQLSAMRNKRGK